MTWSPPDARLPGRAGPPPVPPRARGRRWEDALTGAVIAAVVVLLGAPIGLLWSAVGPHSHAVVEAGGAYISDAESEVFIAGDGYFLGLTLLAGVLTGVLAWLVCRRSGPYAVVALAVGGVIASYVASKVGVRIGQDALKAAVHSGRPGTYTSNIALQATTAIVAWPLGGVAAFAALLASRGDGVDND
ncbi:MAG: hypothetical protein NVSMB55_19130 [Mycobacteriales bacterium]